MLWQRARHLGLTVVLAVVPLVAAAAPVLLDVTFVAPAGLRTALVGPSGAGTSTVLALLERFHGVSAGRVGVAGTDVRELHRDELRARMAYVEQDAPALAGTLRDNLLLGAPDADEADVPRVLDRVDLGELVERSRDGLDAQVGDDGILLSVGQRQRLALARALPSRPAVLLLDEPTASLDARDEQALADAVAAIGPSTTHDELVGTSVLYRDLAARRLLV